MKTQSTKQSDIVREWWKVDADGEILGRMATQIAIKLMGKNKAYFTPHLDCGDYVIVTNAAKVKVSGKKAQQKKYYRHSGFPGGFKETVFEKQLEKDPTKIITDAVKGMLPSNKLKDSFIKRLKVFAGEEHPFEDKKPQSITK